MKKTLLALTIAGMSLFNSGCIMKMSDEKCNEKYTINGNKIHYKLIEMPYEDKIIYKISEKTKNGKIEYYEEITYNQLNEENTIKYFEAKGTKYSNPKDSVYQILDKRFDSLCKEIFKRKCEKATKKEQKEDSIQREKNKKVLEMIKN